MVGECLYDEDDFLTISRCDTWGQVQGMFLWRCGSDEMGCGSFEFTIEVVKVIIIY